MKQILTVFIVMMSLTVFSQQREVTGKVTDDTGQPLMGATLIIKGTTTGTVTDFDGEFAIKAKTGDVISFSYMGVETKNVTVTNLNILNVTLNKSDQMLDEVVVIGYGTQKKKDLTGSVSTVKAVEAYVAPTASLDNALQGRATGVQVTTTSGDPGSSATIRIRGGNSITAGNEPLYVIDGFIGAGDLSTINSNDIESIQILKDASSTAIYGARGTNGVVLVTTKKGKKDKVTINFKTSTGIQQLPNQLDVQTGTEYANWRNSQVAAGSTTLPFDLNNLPGEETNWQDILIHDAPMTDYQLSASGGSENTQYYISAGYLSQDGIVKNTDFERYSMRANIDTRLSKIFKTGVNISLSRTNSNNNNISFNGILQEDPLKPAYDEDGNYTINNFGFDNKNGSNLLAANELIDNETIKSRVLANTYVQAELGKFIWKSTFGGDFSFARINEFTPSTYTVNILQNRLAEGSIDQDTSVGLLNENTLNYSETFGNHSISALGGITFQTSTSESTMQKGKEIPSDGDGVYGLGLAPQDQISMSSGYSENSMFSLLGRLNYSYDDKYLVTATIRRDASSRLGDNNKVGIFPSFALGWKISEESFLKDFSKLDNLKLRTSFGITGNSGIAPFSTLARVSLAGGTSIIDGVPVKGVSQGALANPDLKWETTEQYDLGLEGSFFNGRLTAEVDFYYKKTTDLLLNAAVPNFTGFTTRLVNVGSVENKGIDFTLSGVLVQSEDFKFTTTLNISTNKNKVLNLGINPSLAVSNLGAPANDTSSRLVVGEPVGTFWGAIYDGIDPATGHAIFKDISGPEGVPDGIYSAAYDKTIIGNANPDYYGGIHLDFQYKNFDMNAFFPFSVGNENYNETMLLATETQVNSFSYLRDNMWSAANPDNALFPRVGSSSFNVSNSFYIQDASFFRLGTFQLGYTLPSGTIKAISKCRFYLTGTNLFLIKSKNYLGYDPDVSSYGKNDVKRGFDNLAYPQSRSMLLGLDISL